MSPPPRERFVRAHDRPHALPRAGTPTPFTAEVELAAGHELLLVPMIQELPHNATTLTLDDLTSVAQP